MFKIRYFFSFFFILLLLSAQTPKNFKEFQNVFIKLFKDYQYPYMVEYFEEFSKSMIKSDKQLNLFFLLTLYVPESSIKIQMFEKMLKVIKKDGDLKNNLYMEYGKLHYLNNEWNDAIKNFELSKHKMSYYYAAWSYFYRGNYEVAMSELNKSKEILDKRSDMYYVEKLNFLKIKILIEKKDYKNAYKEVIKLKNSPQKYMLMDRIFRNNKQFDESKKMVDILLRKYFSLEEVKSYLKNH